MRSTAALLVDTSSARDLVAPLDVPPAVARSLADTLVQLQSDWLASKSARSIPARSLADNLNAQLALSDGPEFMRARVDQLTRIRVKMWWQAPDFMVSSPRRGAASAGARLANNPMSPFEAFLVVDALLHAKLYDSDYLRTPKEVAAFPMYTSERPAPGLHELPRSARRDAFRSHLNRLAKERWNSAEDVIDAVRNVFEVRDVR